MNWPATIVRINLDREISKSEWIAFAQGHPELSLESTDCAAAAIHIKGPSNLRIFWSKGSINCGAPTPEIIKIMFQCADRLDAVILGPRNHRYVSLEDWENRTRNARKRRAALINTNKQISKTFRALLGLKILGVIVIGFLLYWILQRSI